MACCRLMRLFLSDETLMALRRFPHHGYSQMRKVWIAWPALRAPALDGPTETPSISLASATGYPSNVDEDERDSLLVSRWLRRRSRRA